MRHTILQFPPWSTRNSTFSEYFSCNETKKINYSIYFLNALWQKTVTMVSFSWSTHAKATSLTSICRSFYGRYYLHSWYMLSGLLIIQFWLGMTINLEVNIPVKYLDPLQSLIYFGSHFACIIAHIVNGLAMLLTSQTFLFLCFKTLYLPLKICTIFILAGVIGDITNGVLFLMSGLFHLIKQVDNEGRQRSGSFCN